MNSLSNSEDWNPHLYISNLLPEDYLLRLNRLRHDSLAEVTLHLYRFYLGWSTADLVRKFLDVPLVHLIRELQRFFAREPGLSSRSVWIYFEGFRMSLKRPCAELHRREGLPVPSGIETDQRMGRTTLRQHLGSDPITLDEIAVTVARRIQLMSLDWGDDETYALFCRARQDDLYHHVLIAADYDEARADDITIEALATFRDKLPTYDPTASSLFTYLKSTAANLLRVERQAAIRKRTKIVLLPTVDEFGVPPESDAGGLSEGLFEDWDEAMVQAISLQVMNLLFKCASPPYHLLAFILHQVLDLAPSEIVAWFSRLPLRILAEIAEQQFLEADFPPAQVRSNFKRFQRHLSKPFEQIVTEPNEMVDYKYLIGSSLGNTRLEDFYQKADEPPPNATAKSARVVQWSNSFVERLITLGVKVGEGPLPGLLRRGARYARRERKQKRSQKNLAQCPAIG